MKSLMRNIKKTISLKYQGVTSLLFVLAIGLVLVVMVAGIALLTIREQQQASNTELSNRALQSAEAGVKKAVQLLDSNPLYRKTDCAAGSDFNLSLGSSQSITCAIVTSIFEGGYEGYLQTNRSQEFLLGPSFTNSSVSPAYIKIDWNNSSDSTSPVYNLGSLYPQSVDGYANAAFVELTIIYWPNTSATPTNFNTKTFLISPVSGSASDADALVQSGSGVKASCDGTGSYKCSTVNAAAGQNGFSVATALGITNVNDYNFDIRILPRYVGTHFKLTAYGSASSGTVINFSSNYAQIDITAKAGNLYRRLKATRQVRPTALDNVFTSVLFAGKGDNNNTQYNICKNFAAQASGTNYIVATANMNGAKPNCSNSSL